eukprot:scaffold5920_cov114-Isochrysis_galbana.AAC.4
MARMSSSSAATVSSAAMAHQPARAKLSRAAILGPSMRAAVLALVFGAQRAEAAAVSPGLGVSPVVYLHGRLPPFLVMRQRATRTEETE